MDSVEFFWESTAELFNLNDGKNAFYAQSLIVFT